MVPKVLILCPLKGIPVAGSSLHSCYRIVNSSPMNQSCEGRPSVSSFFAADAMSSLLSYAFLPYPALPRVPLIENPCQKTVTPGILECRVAARRSTGSKQHWPTDAMQKKPHITQQPQKNCDFHCCFTAPWLAAKLQSVHS